MDLLSAAFLGCLQGVTEWLPISSSAQGILFMINILKIDPQSAFSFSAYLHLGTLLAALLRFRRELTASAVEAISRGKSSLMSFLVISTAFSAVTGFPAYLLLKESFLEQHGSLVMLFIGLLLLATGVILHRSRKIRGLRSAEQSTAFDAAAAGLLQGLTVLPGLSRSGVTLAAMLLRRFRQEDSVKLAFMMSIPAVFGLLAVETATGSLTPVVHAQNAAIVGILVSFVAGYLTLDYLIKWSQKVRFDLFCMLFGLLAAASALAPLLLK